MSLRSGIFVIICFLNIFWVIVVCIVNCIMGIDWFVKIECVFKNVDYKVFFMILFFLDFVLLLNKFVGDI